MEKRTSERPAPRAPLAVPAPAPVKRPPLSPRLGKVALFGSLGVVALSAGLNVYRFFYPQSPPSPPQTNPASASTQSSTAPDSASTSTTSFAYASDFHCPHNDPTAGYSCGIDTVAELKEEDWWLLSDQGIKFTFVFAGRGLEREPKAFRANWNNAKNANILRGAYFVLKPKESIEKQVNIFINRIKEDPGELPPVLDLELYYLKSQGTTQEECQKTADEVSDWLTQAEERLKKIRHDKMPIIYVSHNGWEHYLCNNKNFSQYPLWVVWVLERRLLLPDPWSNWTFWQYDDNKETKLATTKTKLDYSAFNGNFESLKKFAEQ